MVERMNCSNDDFIRTTEDRHHRSSEEIWRRMEKNGDIYLDKYAGWYSVRDEAYYAENETHLNEQKVRIATKTSTPVEWVEEESYFFRLSAYQDKLLALYQRARRMAMSAPAAPQTARTARLFQSNPVCWANGPSRAWLNGRTGKALEMRFSMAE